MKVCIEGAEFQPGNNGVRALAVASIQAILHSYPDAEVFFLNYAKTSVTYTIQLPRQQLAVPLVNMRFSWRFWLNNNVAFLLFLTVLMKCVPLAGLRRRWTAGNRCLRHLQESDLVVAISGGDSFSDIYGLQRFLYVSLPQILALWAGKRLILLPQTLGPFKSQLAHKLAKYIMNRAEAVYARDSAGLRLARAMLNLKSGSAIATARDRGTEEKSRATPKVRFCYDMAFLLDSVPPAHVDIGAVRLGIVETEHTPLVGVNVSGLLLMGGYSRNNMFGLQTDYHGLTHRLIEFLIEQKHATVLLIPHVLGMGRECDTVGCEKVFAELKDKYKDSLRLVRGEYNQNEVKSIIGQCDFFCGSRMHACIAAVSQNVPTVCIAYSDKFIGVMETIGLEGAVADARTMDQGEILRLVNEAYEHRARLRQQLEQKMPEVKETVLNLFG